MRALIALCALAVTPALAQDLPIFQEERGYEILGGIDDGLLVRNGGHAFYCEVDEGPDDRFLVMERCLPILGPKAAASASRATLSRARGEKAFVEAIEALPPSVFIPAVTQTMKEFGCVLDMRTGEDAFLAVLARHVAEEAVYDGEMTEGLIDAIGEVTEDTAEIMMDQGLIVLDRAAGKAHLVNCP
ncbi:hypothetical protein SAMN05216376_102309 [Mameliella alba]|uniref:hypothetical protein n=1 Tax=Mameliella TaxID=1434019 RepID=UPI00088F7645|nr:MULTISPECIES: hypothetical protein [Mameliella]MCR9274551.1 hypothetical protein [Paracoccaceae bacterium]OWV49556.1 hypothetical protein CDZ96_04030 [Mameliella alba]OWV62975.1 hypothetical protein CDZ98_02050 [Mameliella alba]PTR41531.1 hypothetical protein LX94_00822 [Mameliella alba]SDC39160.1 hypothetical protein SAMN05216376_102309 [Mameliella alba]